MRSCNLKAYAKINLGLDVLRRREDGYHEVSMIMQTVNLYDNLYIKRIEKEDIIINCNRRYLPTNENNIIHKTATLLKKEYNLPGGIFVDLKKNIPVAAGMAGGSTDAAAVLVGMNRLFDLGLSGERLMELGVMIGADVPYCVMRGTALSEGIGERLTGLPALPPCYILIAKPEISVSTGFVYKNLVLNEYTPHPDIPGMAEAIRQGDLEGVISRMGNVLETVTIPAYPIVKDYKDALASYGAKGVLMSGSGPTVFGIFTSKEKGYEAADLMKEQFPKGTVIFTRPFSINR